MPDYPLRYTVSPSLTSPANASEHSAFPHAGGRKPGIDCALDPIRNGHRPNVSAFADQIHDGPVIVTALKMCQVQFCRLFQTQAAAKENREKGPISLAFERAGVRHLPECLRLIRCQPVAETNAEVLRPFNSPDASGEIRGQQPRISGLIREAPHRRESAVDRARRKLTRFQMDSIAGDNGLVFVCCVSLLGPPCPKQMKLGVAGERSFVKWRKPDDPCLHRLPIAAAEVADHRQFRAMGRQDVPRKQDSARNPADCQSWRA